MSLTLKSDEKKGFPKVSQLSICYYGSYDRDEPHNSTYLSGLKKVGVHIKEVHIPPIGDRDKAGIYASIFSYVNIIFRFIANSVSLFFRLLKISNINAIIVGYPGYFDLIPAKIYALIKRIPVIFNIHISLYETVVIDRKYCNEEKFLAKILKWFDKLIIRLSDVVLVDTRSHGNYFGRLYRIPSKKFKRVFIGADSIFKPMETIRGNNVKVLFYGTFIPLQGIEYIVHAANLLRNESDLRFEIIGRGQTKNKILELANRLQIDNIDFVNWVEPQELVRRIAAADICLGGQFGTTPKANLVIGYKCYQMMACGKAIIVSDSKGNRELLTHGGDCYMCKAGDAHNLVEAILKLKKDVVLRDKLAVGSRRTFVKKCAPKKIGEDLFNIVSNCLC